MKASVEKRVREQFLNQPEFSCKVAFFSDTIALSISLDSARYPHPAMPAVYLADVVTWAVDHSLRSRIPLAYRGAITLGEYEVSPHFLIGRAIDEAATAYEIAQGAIIWLTPAARDAAKQWLHANPRNTHMVRFDVPLKNGDLYSTYTVSPIMQAKDAGDARVLTATLLRTFQAPSIDVAVKRQNTARHLRACFQWRGFAFPDEQVH